LRHARISKTIGDGFVSALWSVAICDTSSLEAYKSAETKSIEVDVLWIEAIVSGLASSIVATNTSRTILIVWTFFNTPASIFDVDASIDGSAVVAMQLYRRNIGVVVGKLGYLCLTKCETDKKRTSASSW